MLEEEEAPVYTIKKRWWWIRGLLLEETLGRLSGTCLKRSGSEIYIVKKKTKELSWSTSRVSVWYFLPRLAWAFHLLGQDSCNVQRGKRCCCWAKTRRCWEPLIIIIVVFVVYSALLRSPLSSFLFLKKFFLCRVVFLTTVGFSMHLITELGSGHKFDIRPRCQVQSFAPRGGSVVVQSTCWRRLE